MPDVLAIINLPLVFVSFTDFVVPFTLCDPSATKAHAIAAAMDSPVPRRHYFSHTVSAHRCSRNGVRPAEFLPSRRLVDVDGAGDC